MIRHLLSAGSLLLLLALAPQTAGLQPEQEIPADAPTNATWYSTAIPPARFQGAVEAQAFFLPPEVVHEACRRGEVLAPNARIYACAGNTKDGAVLILPDPCLYADTEVFARLACHETGHLNGWPAYHGD